MGEYGLGDDAERVSGRRPRTFARDESPAERLRILIIDDDPDDAWLVQNGLRRIDPNIEVDVLEGLANGVAALTSGRYDAGVVDYRLGPHSGVELIERCRAEGADLPLILITGQGGFDVDLYAMRGGATDYLSKDEATPALLERSIRYGLERVAATAALVSSQRRYEAAVEGSRDGIWDWDLIEGEFHLSRRFKEMLGFDDTTMPDSREAWMKSIHPEDRSAVERALQEHLDGKTAALSIEHRVIHRDSSLRWVYLRGRAQRDENARPERVAGSQTDITSQKAAQADAQHRALHDSLTGIANRTKLLDHLGRILDEMPSRADGFALLYLDLDGFKSVNDVHGHARGDAVLVEVAHRLRASVRSTDFVARIGGDEFVVVLERCSVARAHGVATAIEAAIGQPFATGSPIVHIGVSVGVRIVSDAEQEAEALLDSADREMYSVKLARRGNAANKAEAEPSLEPELRAALRRGAVVPHFQPIVHAADGATVGYEALARWRHPVQGNVSPLTFVPLAEKAGLVGELGRQMLARACGWAAAQLAEPRVSVNISPAHLASPGFERDVEAALLDSGLPAHRLRLEITEHTRLVEDARLLEVLCRLVAHGAHIDIDDFGTGYSALDAVLRLPISALKIDRSLVAGLDQDERKRRMLAHLVAIGHDFGLTLTAEGVETKSEWRAVTAAGVDNVQGYLFGRPEARDESAAPIERRAALG